jgi:IS30 family transposase
VIRPVRATRGRTRTIAPQSQDASQTELVRRGSVLHLLRKRPVSSGRLSLEERLQVGDLYLGGAGVRTIAVGIGRSPATVGCELRRDGSAPTPRRPGEYAPYATKKQAELRGRRPKASRFDHLELATVVQSKLCVKWSPEQISLYLARAFPDRQEMRVCPETIYQVLYVQRAWSSAGRPPRFDPAIASQMSRPVAIRTV